MKIIIGGDIVPINSNLSLFADESQSLFGDVQTHFDQADLSIVNLEVPLTNSENQISSFIWVGSRGFSYRKSPLC